jgi:hypothetical protein
MGRKFLDAARRETQFRHPGKNAPASLILADGTDKENRVSQARGVSSEVQRGAPKVFFVSDDVPQNFANRYDFHGRPPDLTG